MRQQQAKESFGGAAQIKRLTSGAAGGTPMPVDRTKVRVAFIVQMRAA